MRSLEKRKKKFDRTNSSLRFDVRASRLIKEKFGKMFKKSKSKVLVDYVSEEDEISWHHQHTYKVRRAAKQLAQIK